MVELLIALWALAVLFSAFVVIVFLCHVADGGGRRE